MPTLSNGHLTLTPNSPYDRPYIMSNWDLFNYQLTVNGPTELTGFNLLVRSDLTDNTPHFGLANEGIIVAEDRSDLTIQGNLSGGTGRVIASDSSVLVSGSIAASETISLVNNSQLYLGESFSGPQFMPTINIDKTSTIHYYAPSTWAGIGSNEAAYLSSQIPGMVAYLDVVHSLTPGYTPRAELQFGGPYNQPIGLVIVDTPNTPLIGGDSF